jgi:hypothetical protein
MRFTSFGSRANGPSRGGAWLICASNVAYGVERKNGDTPLSILYRTNPSE